MMTALSPIHAGETAFQRAFRECRPYAEQIVAERFGAAIRDNATADLLAGPRCPSRYNLTDVEHTVRHEQHALASIAAAGGRSIEKVAGLALSPASMRAVKARIGAGLAVAA